MISYDNCDNDIPVSDSSPLAACQLTGHMNNEQGLTDNTYFNSLSKNISNEFRDLSNCILDNMGGHEQNINFDSHADASSPRNGSDKIGVNQGMPLAKNSWNVDPVSLHDSIYESGLPNFVGKQIPVPSTMNIGLWHELLMDYEDSEVVDFLTYGWPLGYTGQQLLESIPKNHQSSMHYSSHVDEYIDKELAYGALMGPYNGNPFQIPLVISPLLLVPQKRHF